MSPEQAAGRLDLLSPASDVYSLGATLYVLLTGQRPYRDVADSDLLAQVQKGGCPPPRALKSGTPPALDAICYKAMAHAPQDRYAGALELAADVEHWLADEPVSAFTDPWTVRLGRMARRHRTKLVAAAVLLVSAVVALSASTALVWAEQQKTARQKDLAEKNYELSRDQSFNIIELIEASEADFAAVPALHKTRMDILVLASRACRRYLELEPDDVELRRRTAQVYRYTANVHRLTNAISDAEPLYRDAVRLYAALAEQFPQAPAHQQYVSETLRDQAKLQSNVGRLKEASTTLQRAIALAEKLVNDDPDDANRQRSLAATLLSVAGLQYAQGQFAESGQTAARCATLYRAVLKGASTHPYDRVLLGAALNFQALTEREQGRLDKAIELHKEPTKMLFDLTAKPPQGANRNDVIHFYCAFQTERANSWMQKAEAKWYAVADKALTACIDSWEALAKNYPLVPMYRDSLGTAYQYRGQLRGVFKQDKETPEETTKRLAAARADLVVSQKLLETRVKESPDMPGPHADLGRTYLQQGKLALAMNDPAASATWFTKAAESLTKALELSPDSAASARTLAEVRTTQK